MILGYYCYYLYMKNLDLVTNIEKCFFLYSKIKSFLMGGTIQYSSNLNVVTRLFYLLHYPA